MDANACNFNPEATIPTDDCTFPEPFYNCEGTCENDIDGDGICDELEIAGCNDIDACNYVKTPPMKVIVITRRNTTIVTAIA